MVFWQQKAMEDGDVEKDEGFGYIRVMVGNLWTLIGGISGGKSGRAERRLLQ